MTAALAGQRLSAKRIPYPRTAVYNKDKERRYPCKRLAPHQFKSLQKVMTATELGNCGRSFLFVLFPLYSCA